MPALHMPAFQASQSAIQGLVRSSFPALRIAELHNHHRCQIQFSLATTYWPLPEPLVSARGALTVTEIALAIDQRHEVLYSFTYSPQKGCHVPHQVAAAGNILSVQPASHQAQPHTSNPRPDRTSGSVSANSWPSMPALACQSGD